MNKAQYLQALRDALADRISAAELESVLEYYSEYFDDSGDEAATAASLGDPKILAETIVAQQGLPALRKRLRRKRRWQIPVAVIAVVLALTALAAGITYVRRFADRDSHSQSGQLSANGNNEPSYFDDDYFDHDDDDRYDIDDHDDYHDIDDIRPAESSRYPSAQMVTDTDIDPVQSIDIDTGAADIELVEGYRWHVYMTWPEEDLALNYDCEDGTLYIRSQNGRTDNVSAAPTVVVTVPEDCLLQQLSVHTALGNIVLSDAAAGSAAIGTDLGDITLHDCDFRALACSNSLGNINADELEGATFQCDAEMGDVVLHDCEYGDITVNLDNGNATLTDLPALFSHQEVRLDASLGNVYVNRASHDHSYHYTSQGSARYTLTVNNSSGDINVSFDNDD